MMKIRTDKLQEMVSRAIKGASNNKLLPITSLMSIVLDAGELTLTTTDATNYLYIGDVAEGEDFNVVVSADMFAKLVSKLTCEYTELSFRSDLGIFEIKGNGHYKMEVPLDENGQYIKYPNPADKLINSEIADWSTVINKSTVQVILETLKPALAVTMDDPCYTGYYVGNSIVATDTFKIASMDIKLFDEPRLVSAELMNLLSVMSAEKINVFVFGNRVLFKTPDCVIYGQFMEGLDDFAIDAINGLVDEEMNSMCSVPKSALLQTLDRLSLFVGTYDKNAICLTFTNEGLQISSKASNGVEIIPYVNSENFKDFTCMIDVEMFRSVVKSVQNDEIKINYDEDTSIKIPDGNITIVIALMDDSE